LNQKKNGKTQIFIFEKFNLFFSFRLNISGNSSRTDGGSLTTTTASNRTSETRSYPGRKRPRNESVEHPSINTQLLDGINIIDDDSSQPKFVKLINNSSQEVALNGWVLKRKVGAQLYEFKFPKGMVLKAGATTTVRELITLLDLMEQDLIFLDLEFGC
jgi:hypothetical protein